MGLFSLSAQFLFNESHFSWCMQNYIGSLHNAQQKVKFLSHLSSQLPNTLLLIHIINMIYLGNRDSFIRLPQVKVTCF